MHGQPLAEAWLTADGLDGDRLYAFESANAPPGMLRVSGAERRELLRFRAHGNEVETPDGQTFAVSSTALLEHLREYLHCPSLILTREAKPQTDVRPLSVISLQTIHRLSQELGVTLDVRRFRANLILNLPDARLTRISGDGFPEDGLASQVVRVGPTAAIRILERDPRCRFITYDPDDPAGEEPEIGLMKLLHRQHDSRAGVYAAIVTPGPIRVGDAVGPLTSPSCLQPFAIGSSR